MLPKYKPAVAARRRKRLAPSRPNEAVIALVRALGDLYVRFALGLRGLSFLHGKRLVEVWREFESGRVRLILAFRHPYGDEPQLFSYVFGIALGREARRLGLAAPLRPHARFVHGYEVPLWSGPLIRWILPRMGALPVYHVKFDSASVSALRAAIADGPYPLALAPEGQTSYRSETVPRIEAGTARLAFWSAEDLARAGRPERVLILPLSLRYEYDEDAPARLEAFLDGLVKELRLPCPTGDRPGATAANHPRAASGADEGAADRASPGRVPASFAALKAKIVSIEDGVLTLAEGYYGMKPPAGASRDGRIGALVDEALRRAEAVLGLDRESGGVPEDRIARVYRVRQRGWDRIYPDRDLSGIEGLERRLVDRASGEAWFAMRHMELADLAFYLDSAYLDGECSFERLVEAAYSVADLASRISGGDFSDRPNCLRKRAIVAVSPPLDASERLGDYRRDRRAAVEALTGDISRSWLESIEEMKHGRKS